MSNQNKALSTLNYTEILTLSIRIGEKSLEMLNESVIGYFATVLEHIFADFR